MSNKPNHKPFNYDIKRFQLKVNFPQFEERKNSRGWIDYINKEYSDVLSKSYNHHFPYYLIALTNKSPRHSSILKTKANMVGSQGFNKDKLSKQAIDFLQNRYGSMNADEILKKISYDYQVGGAIAMMVIWSKDRKSIASYHYIPFESVKIGDNPDLVGYYICEDWSRESQYPAKFYAGFTTDTEIINQYPTQILYVKNPFSKATHYGEPNWISCVDDCELDYELRRMNLGDVRRAFRAKIIINWNTLPPEEEIDDYVRRVNETYLGDDGESIMNTFSDGAANAPVITQLNNNKVDGQLQELYDAIGANIFFSHQIGDPRLFGLLVPGQLGTTNQLLESLAIFQSTYITPEQKVIENVFNKLARINGIEDKLEIQKYTLELDKQVSASDLLSILTSPLSNETKVNVLKAIGFSEDKAKSLCANLSQSSTDEPKNNIQ